MCGCPRHFNNDDTCSCFCEHNGVLDGRKSDARRSNLEAYRDSDYDTAFVEYRKTTTIFARQMTHSFQVNTLEGMHSGKAGDFLAVGVHGELYPIDQGVMAASYEEVNAS